MGWFLDWMNARSEAVFFKERCLDLESRLFNEIDGNRRREAALVRVLLRAQAGIGGDGAAYVPFHNDLGVIDANAESVGDTDDKDMSAMQAAARTRLVEARVREYVEEAEASGNIYTPEQITELRTYLMAQRLEDI